MNMTLSQFADLLAEYGCDNASDSLISAWEHGQRQMYAETLWRISRALECTMDSMMVQGGGLEKAEFAFERLKGNEQAILRHAAKEWKGDQHALIRAVGMYMQLPASFRCNVVSMLAIMWDIANQQHLLTDAPYNVSVDDIKHKWEELHD